MVPAFLEGRDYPNLGMCGGLLAQILILMEFWCCSKLVHFTVQQIHARRQLIKVGVITQSYLWNLSFRYKGLPHKT